MFKYLFGNNTSIGEKEKKRKKTIGSKIKDEKYVMIRKDLVTEIPKFEDIEEIQQTEKFKRFLDETIRKADELAIEEWEDGLIDSNVMSDEEFRQQKFLDDLKKKKTF
jgi:hypothetical protein